MSSQESYPGKAEKETPVQPAAAEGGDPVLIDAKGLKCPGSIVKVADYLRDQPEGTVMKCPGNYQIGLELMIIFNYGLISLQSIDRTIRR